MTQEKKPVFDKPCPFCGGKELVYPSYPDYPRGEPTLFSVVCLQCGAEVSSKKSMKDAVLNWNKRAPVSEEEVVERVKAIAKRPEVLRAALRYAVAIIDTLFDDEEEEDAEE